jgi:hypothetical protein
MTPLSLIESRLAAEVAESDVDGVLTWRFEVLCRAGYGLAAAAQIACRQDIDLHVAVELLGRGCDRGTALRILL